MAILWFTVTISIVEISICAPPGLGKRDHSQKHRCSQCYSNFGSYLCFARAEEVMKMSFRSKMEIRSY